MGTVILLVAPFSYEFTDVLEDTLQRFSKAHGLQGNIQVHSRRPSPKTLSPTTIVVTDSALRLGDDQREIIKWIYECLHSGAELLIPGYLDLRRSAQDYKIISDSICKMHLLNKDLKSKNIRQTLHIGKLNGRGNGRPTLAPHIVDLIQREYAALKSIRGTARKLKSQGIDVSRSSVERVIKGRQR